MTTTPASGTLAGYAIRRLDGEEILDDYAFMAVAGPDDWTLAEDQVSANDEPLTYEVVALVPVARRTLPHKERRTDGRGDQLPTPEDLLLSLLIRACADPGCFVDREMGQPGAMFDVPEALHMWQARACKAALLESAQQ